MSESLTVRRSSLLHASSRMERLDFVKSLFERGADVMRRQQRATSVQSCQCIREHHMHHRSHRCFASTAQKRTIETPPAAPNIRRWIENERNDVIEPFLNHKRGKAPPTATLRTGPSHEMGSQRSPGSLAASQRHSNVDFQKYGR